MKLYGRTWKRRELEARVGRLEQIGGIRNFRITDGPEAGVDQIEIRTGAGLTFYVVPTKGMDISLAEYRGAPISWQSPNGDVHPSSYEPKGSEWLRTASGGLLMTCGLTQVGSAAAEGGMEWGLHGRAHHLPARQVAAEGNWNGDEYEYRVRGIVEDTAIFGEKLRLTREITGRLGENAIEIKDTVENIGYEKCPHMLLYHFNFGFPLLSEGTTIRFPSRKVSAREPGRPVEGYADTWPSPIEGFKEKVYYHEQLDTDEAGFTEVIIHNPSFPAEGFGRTAGLKVKLSWDAAVLPRLVQWKMPGQAEHVLGLEPANCWVEGRVTERERNTLQYLQPGEQKVYRLRVDIIEEP